MQLEAVWDWLTRACLGIAFSGRKSRSQTTAVIATVLWRGIGASPCSLLFAPTTCLWTLAVRSPSWITTINWNKRYFSWLWIVGAYLTRGREGGGGGGGAPGKELGLMVLFGLLRSDLLNRVFCMRLPLSVSPGVTFQIKKTGLSKESWEFLIGLNSTNSCVPFLR